MDETRSIITVKHLATKFDLKPIIVRRILRAHSIKTRTIEVMAGWPGQQRKQYWWNSEEKELIDVVKFIVSFKRELAKKQQEALTNAQKPLPPIPEPEEDISIVS